MTQRDTTSHSASDSPTAPWTAPGRTIGDAPPATDAQPVRTEARSNRFRWGIALLVTVLVVGIIAAAVVLLTGQSSPSNVAGYAPSGSVTYGEIRLDLPGDQRQKLGQFLAKFPGFQDQSTLEVKLDDVLDRVVRGMTDDQQDWSTKIKPWFDGELGFGLGALPPADQPEQARGLAIASVKDAAKARAWFDELTADLSKTTATHQGAEIVTFGEAGKSGAMAIHDGRTMLVGDEASVRVALDTGGRSDFAASSPFKEALAALEGDGLGYVFLDLRRFADWMEQTMDSLPQASAIPMSDIYTDLLPDWTILRIQARDNSLAFEAVIPHVAELNVVAANAPGVLAQHVPPSTFVLLDGHEAGASVRNVFDLMKRDPQAAEPIRQLETALGLFGGLDGLTGWMGDAGLALTRDGATITGGLVFQTIDRPKAERLFANLRTIAQLGGAGAGLTVRDEDHNGTPITIIAVDLQAVAGLAGGAVPGGALPPGVAVPDVTIELAYTVTDEVVVLAIGPDFVRAVLDAGPGASLAEDARYIALLNQVGEENTASAFVDIAGLRGLMESLAGSDPSALQEYERNIKPYLLPLDALVQAAVRDGDLDRMVTIVTVK